MVFHPHIGGRGRGGGEEGYYGVWNKIRGAVILTNVKRGGGEDKYPLPLSLLMIYFQSWCYSTVSFVFQVVPWVDGPCHYRHHPGWEETRPVPGQG